MLIFEKMFNKELNRSTFLVGCQKTGHVALIDVGYSTNPFASLIATEDWTITHVLDTHLSNTYLQGGYLLASRTGATYVCGFIKDKKTVSCHVYQASNERPFYIGEVKVSMSVTGDEVVYTFSHEGGLSRSVAKEGEIERNSRLRLHQNAREVARMPGLTDERLPFYTYSEKLARFNAQCFLPSFAKPRALTATLFHEYLDRGRQIVDLRSKEAFEQKFIPGSIFIGNSYVAPWAPYLIDSGKKIILVGEELLSTNQCIDSFRKLGVFEVEGYLDDTLESWDHLGYRVNSIESLEMDTFFDAGFDLIVDVRTQEEVAHRRVDDGVINIPLRHLHRQKKVFEGKRCGFFCSGGVRSLMAASLALNFGAKSCAHLGAGILSCPAISTSL